MPGMTAEKENGGENSKFDSRKCRRICEREQERVVDALNQLEGGKKQGSLSPPPGGGGGGGGGCGGGCFKRKKKRERKREGGTTKGRRPLHHHHTGEKKKGERSSQVVSRTFCKLERKKGRGGRISLPITIYYEEVSIKSYLQSRGRNSNRLYKAAVLDRKRGGRKEGSFYLRKRRS